MRQSSSSSPSPPSYTSIHYYLYFECVSLLLSRLLLLLFLAIVSASIIQTTSSFFPFCLPPPRHLYHRHYHHHRHHSSDTMAIFIIRILRAVGISTQPGVARFDYRLVVVAVATAGTFSMNSFLLHATFDDCPSAHGRCQLKFRDPAPKHLPFVVN